MPSSFLDLEPCSLLSSFSRLFYRAGYSSIQSYVSYSQYNSLPHLDPSLGGILQASLGMVDNELHSSNVAWLDLLLVHGREDDNVSSFDS